MVDWIGRLLGTYHSLPRSANGNGIGEPTSVAVKAASPYPPVDFLPRDGRGSIVEYPFARDAEAEQVSRDTAYAAAAYAYAAMTWRAEKYSEPPLFVGQLTDDDTLEWLHDHALADLLDHPHPDLDMGELLYLTRLYRDVSGGAIWVKDLDRSGRVRRLTPFGADAFVAGRANGRIYGQFRVRVAGGEVVLPAERVVYFREPHPADWYAHVSPLEVALRWLNLGQRAVETVRAVIANALFPGIVIQTDPQWQPTDQEFARFRSLVDAYADVRSKGKPLVLTGGGRATPVGLSLRDLLPSEILDRVEATVAAAFRVPPIVLQFLVGLENSPWSQMEEARRGVTQDLLVPMWSRDAKRITAQLLRAPADAGREPVDPDPMHYVEFDTTQVAALQPDRAIQAETAAKMLSYARVKDLRQIAGLEPLEPSDPRNDLIPGLWGVGMPPGQTRRMEDDAGKQAALPEAKADRDDAALAAVWHRFDASTKAQEPAWRRAIAAQLERDREEIARLATDHLGAAKQSDIDPAEFLRSLAEYLDGPAREAWRDVVEPLLADTGETAIRTIAADLGIAWDVLHPGLLDYTQREAAWLITRVTDTTKQAVRDVLAAGLEAGEGIDALAARIRASDMAFGPARSVLIARTETTRVTNGVQQETLARYAAEQGVTITKTWVATMDGRTRDEHRALHGVTVDVDALFPNELKAPGEPNCRCTLVYDMPEG